MTCPNCSTELIRHQEITGSGKAAPEKGDRCLCAVCFAWLEFDGVRMIMSAPTVGDLQRLIQAMHKAELQRRRN